MSIKRRQFLTGAAGAVAAASTVFSPMTIARNKKYRLGMVTSWPSSIDTLFGTAEYIGRSIEYATDGDVEVEVFAAGEQVGGLEVYDSVSSGAFAMGHTASYYYIGQDPTHAFFTAMPFGLTGQQQNAWIEEGGGGDLWNELNARSNMVAFLAGNTGGQTGGWFNKEINSPEDLKGLKMRFPGVGGQVMARAGVNIQNLPGGQVYFALERGVIDAADWVSPYDDEILQLHKAAKYYYMPSWAEPGATLGLYVNNDIFKDLPKDIRETIPVAAKAANERMFAQYTARNGPALKRLIAGGAQVRTFPAEVLDVLKGYTDEIQQEHADKNKLYAKVYDQWQGFRDEVRAWTDVSQYNFLRYINGDLA
ncbi:family 7 extracellular solute-binding protein [Salinisphaera sp. T5B8]|uniref:TRAP transporter substrate-binding protein n=1 Tax=Salinisphaera sp. T5B8 TaxID=1304154 RepID=UPI003341692B